MLIIPKLMDAAPKNYASFLKELKKFPELKILFGYSYEIIPSNNTLKKVLHVDIYFEEYYMHSKDYRAFTVLERKEPNHYKQITFGELIRETKLPPKLAQFFIFNIDLLS